MLNDFERSIVHVERYIVRAEKCVNQPAAIGSVV